MKKEPELHPPSTSPIIGGTSFRWVRIAKAAEFIGYTETAIRRKIEHGVWLQGQHWTKAPDGCIFINLEEVETWIKSLINPA